MDERKTPYFPIFIDISDKKIFVIGGGNIAERRIATLLTFAKHIFVISPKITDKIKKWTLDGQIHWIQENYHPSFLKDADIVLATTNDPFCNDSVVKYCNENHILVNTSHKKENCDFYFPGIVKQNDIIVGITTSGQNHTEARRAREYIQHSLEQYSLEKT